MVRNSLFLALACASACASAAPDKYGYEVLTRFADDGSQGNDPRAQLTTGPDGALYGVTYSAGAGGFGTVFRVDLAGTITVLHSFSGDDGVNPTGRLLLAADGYLYGTTSNGGPYGMGEIFRLAPNGSDFSIPYPLSIGDPTGPLSGLIQTNDGTLYGTTQFFDRSNYGSVYKIGTDGVFQTIYIFSSNLCGEYPNWGNLLPGADGSLYGTTVIGGLNGNGVIYKITPAGKFQRLFSFHGTKALLPDGPLTWGADGSLYGTAYGSTGEEIDTGSVFRFSLGNRVKGGKGQFSIVHHFTNKDAAGASPMSGLIATSDGSLWGMTSDGPPHTGHGAIFRIAPDGTLTTVHVFGKTIEDGIDPYEDGLMVGPDGALYGMTRGGGAPGGLGTIFRLVP